MRGALSASLVLVSLLAGQAAASAEKPEVTAATVETAGTAQLIRLSVNPVPKSLAPEVVCGEDFIRVRLDTVAARSADLEELDVPAGGPMRRVRIIPKLGAGSVIQIHTSNRTLAACARTTAMQIGSEVVVSMALTKAEQERVAARKSAAKSTETNEAREENRSAAAPSEKSGEAKETALPATEKAEEKNAGTADVMAAAMAAAGVDARLSDGAKEPSNPSSATPTASGEAPSAHKPLGLGLKDAGESKGAKALATGDDNSPSAARIAIGILFAVAVACFAMWSKRRKKKKSDELTDEIDIVSTKRLSAHQQLIVAQVQGTKFLLAVSDKSVTNLGAVPDPNAAATALHGRFAALDPAGPEVVLTPPRSSLESAPTMRDMNREAPMRHSDRNFDREFESALDRTVAQRAPAYRTETPRVAEPSSNVEGLISMARMRATLKEARRGPVAEA